MTTVIVQKTSLQNVFTEFIANLKANELKIEFDENRFIVRPADLSLNVDHYLYGLPKRD